MGQTSEVRGVATRVHSSAIYEYIASRQYGLPYDIYQKDFDWYVSVAGKAEDIRFDCQALHIRIDMLGLYNYHETVRIPY